MNRSEELAKLLEIKGKITCEKHCVGSKVVDKNGEVMCINNCSKSGFIYPDFTKPDNFVKLLEVLINNRIKVEFDYRHNKDHKNIVYVGDDEGKNIIDATISYIKNSYEYFEFDGVEEDINNLKSYVQQTEWTY